MRRFLPFTFSVAVYFAFQATFLYLVCFLLNFAVPKSIDSGAASPLAGAVAVNLGLLAAFGMQHTLMARRRFKRTLARYLPETVERSVFVLSACLMLGLICWQWRPLPQVVWEVQAPAARTVLTGFSLLGWGLLVAATFLLDHLEFTGLKQTWLAATGRPPAAPRFHTPGMYRHIRHPLLAGVLLGIWCVPTMTLGHLVFAAGMSLYLAIGVRLEEADLAETFGRRHEDYRRGTPMLLPRPARRGMVMVK